MSGLPGFAPALPLLVVAWRLRRLLGRFRKGQALSHESARGLDELGLRSTPLLRRLVRLGVLCSTGEGRYWLDEVALGAWGRVRRRRVLGVLAVALVLLALLWGLT